jgi:hypothetical protein
MKLLFVALIACLGFVLATGAEQPKKEAKKKEPAGPVVNGLKLSLSADKTETIISKDGKIEKPVAIKLTFTNVSDKPIKFNAYDFNWSRIKGEAKAMPADSVKIQRIAADRILPKPKAGDFFEIKPGQSWSPGGTLAFPGSLPESVGSKVVYHVVKTGEFRVQFTYNSAKIDNPLANGIWIGELVSNEIVVNVKEALLPKVNEDAKTR